jgi:uncharacterized protein
MVSALMRVFADTFYWLAISSPTDQWHAAARELVRSRSDLYERRIDKGYSLTDCITMNACRNRRIREILSMDHHFAQEGFTLTFER